MCALRIRQVKAPPLRRVASGGLESGCVFLVLVHTRRWAVVCYKKDGTAVGWGYNFVYTCRKTRTFLIAHSLTRCCM